MGVKPILPSINFSLRKCIKLTLKISLKGGFIVDFYL